MRYILFITLLTLLALGCRSQKASLSAARPVIIDKPISWDSTRRVLSLEYMRVHHGIEVHEPIIEPRMIVVHWTAAPTLEASFATFDPSVLPGRPDLQAASRLNVSVPFLIDRDGSIYQLMPETRFARHVIGLNHCAIGIENVGDGDQHPLTEAQYQSNVLLIRYLMAKYPDISFLIGHHEYRQFKDHPLYRESDPNYFTLKQDPGDAFMERLRGELANERIGE